MSFVFSKSAVARVVVALLLATSSNFGLSGASTSVPAALAQTAPAPPSLASWAVTAPVIDGAVGSTEWANAGAFPLPHGQLYFENDASNLYVLADLTGDTGNDSV